MGTNFYLHWLGRDGRERRGGFSHLDMALKALAESDCGILDITVKDHPIIGDLCLALRWEGEPSVSVTVPSGEGITLALKRP